MNDLSRPPRGEPSLSAVLVPTTRKELPELFQLFFIWGGLARLADPPESERPPCKLIVTLDCGQDGNLLSQLRSAFDGFGLSGLFDDLEVGFCDIPVEDNIYVRPGQHPPEVLPRLGLKSGPNLQFFRSLLDHCGGENVVLLNEVDCFPVSKDWLRRLSRLARNSEPFWILGSPYRGYSRLGPEIVAHINGNALYGTATEGFRDVLLQHWRNGLERAIPAQPDLAYDVYLDYASHAIRNPDTWRSVPLEEFRFFSSLLCKVRCTDLIHNLAGAAEINGSVRIDLADYLVAYPAAVLVHGRFLAEQVIQSLADELGASATNRAWLAEANRRLASLEADLSCACDARPADKPNTAFHA